jgi:broad specificity phosphatase PhoE
MTTTIILVRHGQTEWNRVERFRGRYDVPLNTTGLDQAKLTANRIATRWKPAVIYSSPLSRAMQTAEIIAKKFLFFPIPTDDLLDINYGLWQGLTPAEAKKQWPKLVTNWYEHPEAVEIPGGETLLQVRNRATPVLNEISSLHPDQEIVLVSHTVVNRLILLSILCSGIEHFWNLRQEPCAINVIEKSENDFTLVSMNDTCHLL